MNNGIIAPLEQQRRDALVAYYLGQLVGESGVPRQVASENDLYEYLLIDNQVSGEVDTSRVAQGIASVQQHVHAIYNGMEPGFGQGADDEPLKMWRDGMAQYSLWAGYQMLQDYPENYLDPTLRLGKTDLFKTLEGELAQARLSADTVQMAIGNYLQQFETVSNLAFVGGYTDSADFVGANYYFIARQRIEPFAFYWRSARLAKPQAADGTPRMADWTQWQPVTSVMGAHVRHCQPVILEGRLYVAWIQVDKEQLKEDGTKTGVFDYRMSLSYRRLDGSWSVPTVVHRGTVASEDLADHDEGSITKGYRFAVSTDHDKGNEPRLLLYFRSIGYQDPQVTTNDLVALNKLLIPMSVDTASDLTEVLVFMQGSKLGQLQYPCDQLHKDTNLQWRIKSVTWDRDQPPTTIGKPPKALNEYFELHADWEGGRLKLQGECRKRVYIPSNIQFEFYSAVNNLYGSDISFLLRVSTDEGRVVFSVTKVWVRQGVEYKFELFLDDEQIAIINNDDFGYVLTRPPYKHQTGVKVLEISPEEIVSDFDNFAKRFSCRAAATSFYLGNFENGENYKRHWYAPAPITTTFYHYQIKTLASDNLVLNGATRSRVIYENWPASENNVRIYQWGGSSETDGKIYGLNGFVIEREPISGKAPCIIETPLGAQFLDLDIDGVPPDSRYVRLNTLFARELIRKASLSLESVFNWETQHTDEPPPPDQTEPVKLDFNGANSLYFWELFFHVPHLIASRLQSEFDYLNAERWLCKLFDPQVRVAPLYPPPSETEWLPYWTCRPLGFQDQPALELGGLADPDAIARGAPSHYRKAIFMLYVNNLIAWGDMLYRQVTRDTLNEAKLLYVRALSLLGPLSKGRSISRWEPAMLGDVVRPERSSFVAFELSTAQATPDLADEPTTESPWLRLLDVDAFRLPVNTQLLDLWDRLDLRLHNLRHNLTLDGKPLQLALYEAPANPLDLLRAQQSGSSLSQRRLGSMTTVAPYRFRALLPRVQNAVETLIGFGERVRAFMELRDRVQQDELQQGHVLELAKFAENIQQEMIEQASKGLEVLHTTKATITGRQAYYRRLVEKDVSGLERSAHENLMAVKNLSYAARHVSAAGQAATMAPNLFGTTFGGMNWGGSSFAASDELQAKAVFDEADAQEQLNSDMQRRRREEWAFQSEQAEIELEEIEQQIEVQRIVLRSATTSLAQSTKALEQAQALYAFLKNRSAGEGLYQWLLSQISTLYFQAYDAVLAMCLTAEASWQYEIGDRDTRFISTSAWADNRFGLTAGETLKLGMLQMEAAFLARHERRLELTRTISLKALLLEQAGEEGEADALWQEARETLLASGELAFNLRSSTFDRDYPGHYLRQLVRVSVSLPVVLGPWQDLHVTLSQQASSYLLKPQIGNVKHLYQRAGELPDGGDDDIRQDFIVSNPRPNQQIGLSTGLDDHGMFAVDFGDERYYPFEGTGAISNWTLSFPNHESEEQQAVIESLTDVIVHVRYLALDGGQAFAQEVEDLLEGLDGKAVATRPDGTRLSAPR